MLKVGTCLHFLVPAAKASCSSSSSSSSSLHSCYSMLATSSLAQRLAVPLPLPVNPRKHMVCRSPQSCRGLSHQRAASLANLPMHLQGQQFLWSEGPTGLAASFQPSCASARSLNTQCQKRVSKRALQRNGKRFECFGQVFSALIALASLWFADGIGRMREDKQKEREIERDRKETCRKYKRGSARDREELGEVKRSEMPHKNRRGKTEIDPDKGHREVAWWSEGQTTIDRMWSMHAWTLPSRGLGSNHVPNHCKPDLFPPQHTSPHCATCRPPRCSPPFKLVATLYKSTSARSTSSWAAPAVWHDSAPSGVCLAAPTTYQQRSELCSVRDWARICGGGGGGTQGLPREGGPR